MLPCLFATVLLACSDDRSPVEAPAGGEDSGADSAPPAEAPLVAFVTPSDGATVQNPVTFTFVTENVATVALDADGYSLGEPAAPASSVTYTFDGTGYPRVVTLTGYDSDGVVVATDVVTVTVEAPETDGVLLDVPYFYQMENAYEPTSTCGLTSGAMLVDYWNAGSVTPDGLYLDYGKSQGQSPSGLAALYEAEGLNARYSLTATRAELRTQLDEGRPVIVHGYFTSAGHIVVLVGYDSEGWYANDSAGDWAEGYFNGYGEGAYYPYGGGWDDALGSDGDIWYSVADEDGF